MQKNRMVQAWANNQWQTYSYDGDGRRVKRVVNGTEIWQVYGFAGELLAEYPANGRATNPQKEYGYRNGQLLIRHTAASWLRMSGADIPTLPSRIVLLETNGYISIDVLNWLSTHEIPLIVMTWKGGVTTTLGGQASDMRLVQLAALENGLGFRLAIELIRRKIKASQRTLNSLPITSAVDSAI